MSGTHGEKHPGRKHDSDKKSADKEKRLSKEPSQSANGAYYGWIDRGFTLAAVVVSAYAVLVSSDANKHAAEANKITRESFELQNRAWITFQGGDFVVIVDARTGKLDGGEARFQFKNTGNTPALNLQSFITAKYFPTGQEVPEAPPFEENTKRVTIGPGALYASKHFRISTPMLAGLASKRSRLIYDISLYYDDIFSNERRKTTKIVEFKLLITEPELAYPETLRDNWVFTFVGVNDEMT